MAESLNLLHTVSSFYSVTIGDAGPNLITFSGRGQYYGAGGGGFLIKFTGMDVSAAARSSSVILPNGSKYDPFQTYNGPQTPGELSIDVAWIPDWSGISAGTYTLNQTESAMQYYYYSSMYMLNRRGELTGANADNDVTTATGRLIEIDARWNMPKQIPTAISGQGQNTRGIEYVTIRYTFDMLTKWSWT